jgi:hypothetical protein
MPAVRGIRAGCGYTGDNLHRDRGGASMRTPTDYRNQLNRCDWCGHRWAMHNERGCSVKTRDKDDPEGQKECKCGRARG